MFSTRYTKSRKTTVSGLSLSSFSRLKKVFPRSLMPFGLFKGLWFFQFSFDKLMARQVQLNDGKCVMSRAEIRNRCYGVHEVWPRKYGKLGKLKWKKNTVFKFNFALFQNFYLATVYTLTARKLKKKKKTIEKNWKHSNINIGISFDPKWKILTCNTHSQFPPPTIQCPTIVSFIKWVSPLVYVDQVW